MLSRNLIRMCPPANVAASFVVPSATAAPRPVSQAGKPLATAPPRAPSPTREEVLKYHKAHSNPGVVSTHNLVLTKGEGSYMWDMDGRKFLDFTCGIGVTNLGHCHPRLVKVVQRQAAELWHPQFTNGTSLAMYDLIKELETVFPKPLDNFTFVSTGTEAVEAALRLCRAATGRPNVLTFQGGFHGRTVGTASLTTSKYVYHKGLRPLMPGVIVAPRPFTSQMRVEPTYNTAKMVEQCLGMLEDLLHQVTHPSEVAMMIIEPVMGEGGYVPLPAAYFRGLRAICDKYGILLVLDEIQTGFGRTGTMFNYEQMGGCLPDVVTFAKGVANGLPLAGFVTTSALAAKQLGGQQGGTYSGNPIVCGTAAEVIRVFREERVLENVRARGLEAMAGLRSMVTKHKLPVQEVRGRGLMLGIQFDDGMPAGTAGDVAAEACREGLLVLNTSKYEVLRLIPPLNVTADQVQEGLSALEKAMVKVCASKAATAAATTKYAQKLVPCCAEACQGGEPCRFIAV